MDSKEKFQKKVGQRINTLLSLHNKKQLELANYLGITDNTVSLYCSGKRIPNAEKLCEIAKYFDVTTDYLLGLSEAPTNNKDISDICDYTGLSVKSVDVLHNFKNSKLLKQISLINHLIESKRLLNVISTYYNTFVFDEVNKNGYELIPKKDTIYSSETYNKLAFAQLIEMLPKDKADYEEALTNDIKEKQIFNVLKQVADIQKCKVIVYDELPSNDEYDEDLSIEDLSIDEYDELIASDMAMKSYEDKVSEVYAFLQKIEEGEQSGKHTED